MQLTTPTVAECADCPQYQRTADRILWPTHEENLVIRLAHEVKLIQDEGIGRHHEEIEDLIRSARPMMYRRVFRIVRHREEAEDLTQDASVRICRKIGNLHEPRKFLGWAGTIAARTALKYAVTHKHHIGSLSSKHENGELDPVDPAEDRNVNAIIHEERVQLVYRVLTVLPESDSALLARFYLEDASYEELVRELNIPVGTVKSRLHTARVRFQERYHWLSNPQ